jgi:tetratricopeptide (TPR) repeat protein
MAGRLAALVFLLPVLAVVLLDPARAAAPAGLPSADGATRLGLVLLGLGRTALYAVLPVGLHDDMRAEALAGGAFELTGASLVVAVLVALALLLLVGRLAMRRASSIERALLAYLLFGLVTGLLGSAAAVHEVRWAYLGAVPLFAAAGGCVAALFPARGRGRALAVAGAVAALLALGFLTHLQTAWAADEVARLERRLDLDPDDVLALEALSTHHRREAELRRAAAALLPASDPQRGEHNIAAGEHLAVALAASRRATEHPVGYRRSRAWATYGLALLSSGRPPDALPWLQRAAQLDPALRDPQALARHVGGPQSLEQAELFHAIGQASMASGLPEEALDPLVFAALLAPENPTYLRRAGLALNAAGRYAEGLAHLERAWRAAGGRDREEIAELLARERSNVAGRADLHLQRGHRARDAGDYVQARREYEAALAVDPDLVEGLIEGGWLAGWHFGRYEEGLARLDRAEALLRGAGAKGGDPGLALVERRRADLIERRREDDARLAREEAAAAAGGATDEGSLPPR